MATKTQSQYGSWESIFTPEKIIEGGLRFNEIRIDNQDIYFLEGRPSESGRSVIIKHNLDGTTANPLFVQYWIDKLSELLVAPVGPPWLITRRGGFSLFKPSNFLFVGL